MKKSIALFVTIAFLFIVIGILGVVLQTAQKLTSSKNYFIAQDSLLIKSTLDKLGVMSDEINTSEQLKQIFTTFPISNDSGTFRAIYTISPLFDRIDINTYLQNGKINENVDFYINNILDYYQVQDPVFFKDLLLDTLDKDSEEREAYSEIVLKNPDFQNGKIYNADQLYEIEKYYSDMTEDNNVFKIPWEKLIFFGNGEHHILECSLLNKKTAKFLGLVFENEPECNTVFNEENIKTAQNFDIIEYKKNSDFWINVVIDYFYNDIHNSISIIYNIYNKKVISVESHPVY